MGKTWKMIQTGLGMISEEVDETTETSQEENTDFSDTGSNEENTEQEIENSGDFSDDGSGEENSTDETGTEETGSEETESQDQTAEESGSDYTDESIPEASSNVTPVSTPQVVTPEVTPVSTPLATAIVTQAKASSTQDTTTASTEAAKTNVLTVTNTTATKATAVKKQAKKPLVKRILNTVKKVKLKSKKKSKKSNISPVVKPMPPVPVNTLVVKRNEPVVMPVFKPMSPAPIVNKNVTPVPVKKMPPLPAKQVTTKPAKKKKKKGLIKRVLKIKGIGAIGAIFGFFDLHNIQTLDELKKEYYRLAKRYHPDAGGSNEDMKLINAEYDTLFKAIQSGKKISQEEKDIESGISEVFKEIINQVMRFPALNIEIVGNWVWVSGNTYPVREELKKAGFLFASTKKMWFWRPDEYKTKNYKGEMSMDEIRAKYGSQRVTYQDDNRYLSGTSRNNSLSKSLKKLQKLLKRRAHIQGIGAISEGFNLDYQGGIQ